MIILIAGASHTGKTLLAQQLLERYHYPVLSQDLLKMGLIRSGQTTLTPTDDDALEPYLWSITAAIIKTAIENKQNLIVEGCYIPFTWQNSFSQEYLDHIHYFCLVMSENYITKHHNTIQKYANIIEARLDNEVNFDELIKDNKRALAMCSKYKLPYYLIDAEKTAASSPEYAPLKWEITSLNIEDCMRAAQLFYETVHSINVRDYTPEQIDAWAPNSTQHQTSIAEKLTSQTTIGVKECGILIGFGSLENSTIDMLYVHKDRQNQRIAQCILAELEQIAKDQGATSLATYASITALPFFKKAGYKVERENIVCRNGIKLTNFYMTKALKQPAIVNKIENH